MVLDEVGHGDLSFGPGIFIFLDQVLALSSDLKNNKNIEILVTCHTEALKAVADGHLEGHGHGPPGCGHVDLQMG